MKENLFEDRPRLTPAKFPWAEETLLGVLANSWVHTEVSMQPDIQAWTQLPEPDKQAIRQILQGFTLMESFVGCYWREVVAHHFKAPEIIGLATVIASQEVVHAYAYNLLESSLNLDTYQEFILNPDAKYKLGMYADIPKNANRSLLANSLVFMSGCGEGISLFSSFIILLSYVDWGVPMRGLKEILSWSIRDEQIHSDVAARLYFELEERVEANVVYRMFEKAVEAELNFIRPIFNVDLMTGLNFSHVQEFIKYRANDRLKALGYEPLYKLNHEVLDHPRSMFENQTRGTTLHDFFVFHNNGGAYSTTAGADFLDVDLSAL